VKLDLKLTGGRVVTLDPARPCAATVGIWQGRVVGLDDDVANLQAAQVVDLGGAVVLPGFVDAHTHLAWTGRASRTLDVSTCRRVHDVLDVIARATGDGWLEVAGHDHRRLDRALTATDLDSVSAGREVYVQDLSGHACVVNTAILRRLPHEVLAPGAPGVQFDAEGWPTGALAEGVTLAAEAGVGGIGQLQDDPNLMAAAIVNGHAAGWQLAVHAIGDRAVDFALDAVEQAQRLVPRPDARHRIEHCGLVRPHQLDRIAALRLIPVVQPTFLWVHGDDYAAIMGQERAPRMYRGRAFLDRGITIAGSSDRPVADGSPLRAIQFMVERMSPGRQVIGGNEAVTVEQAVAAYTRRCIRVSPRAPAGQRHPGKLADLVVLGDDPRAVDPSRIGEIDVLATVAGGEFAHDPARFASRAQ
jgi:predicted amidohydrolase YtcJ